MSNIKWIECPACQFRFYIIEEQAGHGYTWFCPKCRHEFTEDEAGGRVARAASHHEM